MRYFNFILALLFSLVYASGKIPPSEKFNLWITAFIIPVALGANIVLLLVALFLRRKSSFYYIVALVIGGPYLFGTFGLKSLFRNKPSPGFDFSVVNYNMGSYNMRPYYYENEDSARLALRNWLLAPNADIKCFQEFTNYPWSNEFNVIKLLDRMGSYYSFSQEKETDHTSYSRTGTLIISRFPIIASGDLLASENGFNRIAYADVRILEDTVRIVNVHLESMGLTRFRHRVDGFKAVIKTTMAILTKLKTGVFERSNQIRQLRAFIKDAPYPVICAGDFNELPYSYSYQFMKKGMKNAFEESGVGFGFTYNGRTLSGLRIDNQFYSPSLRSVEFETLDEINLSDHFPVRGVYQLKP